MLDVHGSLQLLNSSHARERDKALLRSIMVGGVWNGFLLGRVRSQVLTCQFCGALDGDGHLFWECTFLPLVEVRENPEFHDLMRMDKGHWPRCLLWHGWLPTLSEVPGASPWAPSAPESASYLVEAALGCHSSGLVTEWSPLMIVIGSGLPPRSLINPMSGLMVALSLIRSLVFLLLELVFFAHQSVNFWSDRRWGHVDHVRPEGEVQSCRGFCSVPGVSFLALQSSGAVHLGVDNLGVIRHVGLLLDGHHGSVPLELVKDGDLLLFIERMLHLRGLDTVRISNVKGHADESMVLDGRVREVDRLGKNAADEVADFGRRTVGNAVIDARRNLSRVCGRWYPVLLDLHRFLIAISRAVVNHDGREGTAPDPLVWSAGARPKRRRLVHAVRDRA